MENTNNTSLSETLDLDESTINAIKSNLLKGEITNDEDVIKLGILQYQSKNNLVLSEEDDNNLVIQQVLDIEQNEDGSLVKTIDNQ